MRSYQVVEFGHTLRDTDMLDPKPTGDEVVIAVKAAGVCHSDLHIWEGGFDLGGGRKLTTTDELLRPSTPVLHWEGPGTPL